MNDLICQAAYRISVVSLSILVSVSDPCFLLACGLGFWALWAVGTCGEGSTVGLKEYFSGICPKFGGLPRETDSRSLQFPILQRSSIACGQNFQFYLLFLSF